MQLADWETLCCVLELGIERLVLNCIVYSLELF